MNMLSFEIVHSRRIFSKQKLMMSKSREKQTRYVDHVLMYQWFTLLIKNYQHRKWATSLVIHAKYMHEWLKRCFLMTSDPPLYMLKILLSKHLLNLRAKHSICTLRWRWQLYSLWQCQKPLSWTLSEICFLPAVMLKTISVQFKVRSSIWNSNTFYAFIVCYGGSELPYLTV